MSATQTMEPPKGVKRYDSELEKQLMVQNLRAAVEIYGKDQLRKQFKRRKKIKALATTH